MTASDRPDAARPAAPAPDARHPVQSLADLPPAPPHLPAPMRLLSQPELRAVHDGVRAAARRRGVTGEAADEISFAGLAAAGLFLPPPAPDPHTCTALYLPHEPGAYVPEMLGQWQQCDDEPGHEDVHSNGDTEWSDDTPGAVPAGTTTEVRP
ncbi:hypothetical protein [Streptomyces chrestomyceticus]|uniref:hypothetical protein n=1 Tax=Streptomyces chrestomyceticus TaxID=68185 RepID=UPI0033D8990D